VLATLVVRNEIVRVASTLNHHRALGVAAFLVVDNGSSDGTREYLAAQPDVCLWSTDRSFGESNFGTEWRNAILDAHAAGRWVLYVDADELFIYPGFETRPLPVFCRFLDGAGARIVFAVMLDMYSDKPLAETAHPPGGSLIETCPFFDRRPYSMTAFERFPGMQIRGGVRQRLLRERLGREGPLVSKTPLVRWSDGVRFADAHYVTMAPVADVTGALLHFKFLSDFHAKAEAEAARGEHWNNASEYRAYLALMQTGLTTLMSDVSARYEDSAQLVRMNLMRTSEGWERAPLS